LEYASPVWHHLITKARSGQIEAIQRRAIGIIYDYTYRMPYTNALYVADIPSLVDRRKQLSRNFFKSVLKPTSCLFYTLPPQRDASVISRLRTAPKLSRIPTHTNKYKSFISYALSHFKSK